MTRIATDQTYSSALLGIDAAQQRAQVAGAQVSTGKVAADLKGYAASAQTLTAAQSVKARVDAYLQTDSRLADKLQAQDTALTTTNDAVSGARKAVTDALATGDATTLMQSLQTWYAQAASALNTDYEGSYLFSGGNGATAPVDTGTMTDLNTGGAASHFTNGTLQSSDRLDDDMTAQTSFTASDVGGNFFSVLQGIVAQNASTPFTGKLTAAQQTFLTAQLAPLDAAASGVQAQAAANGVNQNRVDTVTATLTDRQTAAANVISGVTDADPAQASTNLQLANYAVQASAKVWQTLSSDSLLNILSTTT